MSTDVQPTITPVELLPWQHAAWQRLQHSYQQGRLAHALLVGGATGLGQDDFSRLLAKSVLCQQPRSTAELTGLACGQCSSCRQFDAGSHPDYYWVTPKESSKLIRVDDIRQLITSFSLTSQYGGMKVAIITPAHAMNVNAANSLLKTLEEPSGRTLIILVSDKAASLMPTIKSRCQRYDLTLPSAELAKDWLLAQGIAPEQADLLLKLANQAPLEALRIAGQDYLQKRQAWFEHLQALSKANITAVDVAQHWHKEQAEQVIAWLNLWLADLLKMVSLGADAAIINEDMRPFGQTLLPTLSAKALFALYDLSLEQLAPQAQSLNKQLQLERLLLNWSQISRLQGA